MVNPALFLNEVLYMRGRTPTLPRMFPDRTYRPIFDYHYILKRKYLLSLFRTPVLTLPKLYIAIISGFLCLSNGSEVMECPHSAL